MKRKPKVPACLKVLGFDQIPENISQIKTRYRQLAKKAHPDQGGSFDEFVRLRKAFERSIKLLEKGGQQCF